MGRQRILLIVVVIVVAVALAAAWSGGWFEDLEAESLGATLRGTGIWAPLVYTLAFALLEPFFVPGILFIVAGSLVWSWGPLFLLSWAGAVGAGIVGFGFARTIGRDWVQRHLPERMRRYDERLETRGFTTVVIVRVLFFLAPPAHWLLGLSRVSFGPFVLGSMVGFVPGMAILTAVGKGTVDWLSTQSPWIGVALVAGVALVFALIWWRRSSRAIRDGDA